MFQWPKEPQSATLTLPPSCWSPALSALILASTPFWWKILQDRTRSVQRSASQVKQKGGINQFFQQLHGQSHSQPIALLLQMIQSLLDRLNLKKMYRARSLWSGCHLLMSGLMIACTTQFPNWTRPKERGARWLTSSSTTSSQSATSCWEGYTISASMRKMTWAFLHHQSHQPGGWRRRKVGFCISKTKKL